jgi:hypothetical protein
VGIMSVVTYVGRSMDDEDDPTWDEAVAAFDAATPVELLRSPRQVTVVYRYADDVFTATSPELRGFRITGRSLHEAKALVRHDLEGFLDPAIEVLEHVPAGGPESCTATAGHSLFFRASSLPGLIVLSSSGTARTFISPARAFAPLRELRTS